MPDEGRRPDDIKKILHDEKAVEGREKALIGDLLKQRIAAIAAFDEKLEKPSMVLRLTVVRCDRKTAHEENNGTCRLLIHGKGRPRERSH